MQPCEHKWVRVWKPCAHWRCDLCGVLGYSHRRSGHPSTPHKLAQQRGIVLKCSNRKCTKPATHCKVKTVDVHRKYVCDDHVAPR